MPALDTSQYLCLVSVTSWFFLFCALVVLFLGFALRIFICHCLHPSYRKSFILSLRFFPGGQRRSSSGGWSLTSADSSDSHLLQHFSGLLHGSSPVCEVRDPPVPCEPSSMDSCRNGAASRMELPLRRSLSKSDSDLLTCSPPAVGEGEDWNRSESLTNCAAGGSKKRLEKSPSFTSEWDEVSQRNGGPLKWHVSG